MKIDYKINRSTGSRSFLHEAEISFYLLDAFKPFEGEFEGVEVVNVDLEERFYNQHDVSPRRQGILNRNASYDITIRFNTFANNKGKVSYPSPREVFSQIDFIMKGEAEHFKSEFDRQNPILRKRLKMIGADMDDNKNILANELHGSLGSAEHKVDLGKRLWELSDDDYYELGKVLIVSGTGGKPFSKAEIVARTEKMLEPKL